MNYVPPIPWYDNLIGIFLLIFIILWLILLVMGAFKTSGHSSHRHMAGSGHITQRFARGKSPLK